MLKIGCEATLNVHNARLQEQKNIAVYLVAFLLPQTGQVDTIRVSVIKNLCRFKNLLCGMFKIEHLKRSGRNYENTSNRDFWD